MCWITGYGLCGRRRLAEGKARLLVQEQGIGNLWYAKWPIRANKFKGREWSPCRLLGVKGANIFLRPGLCRLGFAVPGPALDNKKRLPCRNMNGNGRSWANSWFIATQRGELEAGLFAAGPVHNPARWLLVFSCLPLSSAHFSDSALRAGQARTPCPVLSLPCQYHPQYAAACAAVFAYTFRGQFFFCQWPSWREFTETCLSPVQELATAIYAPVGQLDRMTAAVLALGIYQCAYMAEIFRAGIESVDRGQWDASLALGFSRAQSLRHVILPQSFRLILPPMTGQAISSFKDSAPCLADFSPGPDFPEP